ncbi:MAG: TonB-dependent receptor [Prevotella sp.]|nr:TonB-dependent receptor [Prevotella sp.]
MYSLIKRALLLSLMSVICMVASAQSTITGNVKDASGEPMIGVTVMVDDKVGAITDFDGNFSINDVSHSSKLKISYIGYKDQTVAVGNKTVFNIVLEEDNQSLNEVVVVGYGTMKKTDLTGSVSSVNTDQLNAKGAPNVLENLQGSVPGVSITKSTGRTNGGYDIEIRGKSSINSDVTPMYVVDGIIMSDIDWLNPQDIERIDVLKDASSTAIYGSRATAGVVMVTTKSGTTVDKKATKPSISYDGYYGISNVTRMPDLCDGQQFYNYRFLRFLTNGSQSTLNGQTVTTMGQTDFKQMGLYNTSKDEYRMKSMLESGDTYDWPGMVTQNGKQQNHYLAVSGSTDALNYHVGLGYSSDEGVYKGDSEEKFNFKGSLDATINKYISAGFSVNLAKVGNSYANDDGIKNAYRMAPYSVPYDSEGNLNQRPGNYAALGSDSSNQFTDDQNPLILLQNAKERKDTYRAISNIYLQINPYKGITFKTTFSPDFTYYRDGSYTGTLDESANNEAMKTEKTNFSYKWDNVLTWDQMFGENHHLNIMGLYSVEYAKSEQQKLDYTSVLDGTYWWNMSTGDYAAGSNSANSYSESSLMSYALRGNYTLMGRYMLTATIRWDGSSKFTKDYRWGSFPSVALAWRLSEEPFMAKTKKWLSNAKVRLSYGVTGNNAGIGNYDTQQTVSSALYYPFGSTYYTGFYPSGVVDASLQWEKSHEYNVGIDFGFLNERIRGSVDWYQKTSKDLLYSVNLPLESGGGTVTTNIGSVRNTGIEVSLTTENIATKDWHWTTTFTFAHNKNTVREINGTGNYYSGSPTGNLIIGRPYNNLYGYEWKGIVNDKMMTVPDNEIAKAMGFTPGSQVKSADYYYTCYGWYEGSPIIVDRNGDGKFTDDDKKIYNSDPAWTGSITSNLTWKDWDFSFSIYAKQNFKVESSFMAQYLNYGYRGWQVLSVDYYIPAGTLIDCDGVNDDGTYINPVYQETTHYGSYPFPSYQIATASVTDQYWDGHNGVAADSYVNASFVKVKNITLGYTFPSKWMKKIGCNKLRIYCTVTNPFVFTKYKGFDPEWADAATKNDGPSTITWQFGANIKF